MTLTADEVLARCEAMVPALIERADEGERERRLPDATFKDVTDNDLWRLVVPTSLGGHGLGIEPLANAARILAHGCPASAWAISFLVMHSWLLAKFPAAARDELFLPERPYALTPAPLAPTGTLDAVDGGFVVTGRWEWATGLPNADWVMVHAVQLAPQPANWFLIAPIDEVAIDDVWFASGMRATGSNTVRLHEQFVPAHRAVPAATLMAAGVGVDGDGLAGIPVPPVLALVAAAAALGAAEAAVEDFRRRIAGRVLAYTAGERQQDQPVTQARLGAAISELAATRARWDAAIERLAAVTSSSGLGLDERMAMRLTAAATVRSSREIIAIVADGSGAGAYLAGSPLQRLQRDVEVLKGHVLFDWDRTTELAGRFALELPLRPTDMI